MRKLLLILASCSTLFSLPSRANDVYLGANFPTGAVIGYTYKLDRYWNLRADYAPGLSRAFSGTYGGLPVDGTASFRTFGGYADWFVFDNPFRFTIGLVIPDIRVGLQAVGPSATFNGKTVSMSGEFFRQEASFQHSATYLGVGWGHFKGGKGLSFYADIGGIFGAFEVRSSETSLTTGSTSTQTTWWGTTTITIDPKLTQADVDAQNNTTASDLNRLGFIPMVSIGLLYRY